MKIFKEKEIDEATKDYRKSMIDKNIQLSYIERDFPAGIKFAESKMERIFADYTRWLFDNSVYAHGVAYAVKVGNHYEDYTAKELFEQFINERNKK